MPADLILGIDSDNDVFSVPAADFGGHTCITGKSGCAKTSLLARLLEEIVLKHDGNVLLFDYNFDFAHFSEPSLEAFSRDYFKRLYDEDDEERFVSAWEQHQSGIRSVAAEHIRVPVPRLSAEELAFLFNIQKHISPGAYWMLRLMAEDPELSAKIATKGSFRQLFTDLAECGVSSFTSTFGPWLTEIISLTRTLERARLRSGADYVQRSPYLVFDQTDDGGTTLDQHFVEELFGGTRFVSLDLLNFSQDDYRSRDFVVFYLLRAIWERARENYRRHKEDESFPLKPLFLVVDEAHNVMPEGRDTRVGRMFERIAAEGRKLHLHLLIASQRPDKINRNITSECENLFLMQSSPAVVELVRPLFPIDAASAQELIQVRSFPRGKALVYGAITDHTLIELVSNGRRTR